MLSTLAHRSSEDLTEAMNTFIERRPGRYGGR